MKNKNMVLMVVAVGIGLAAAFLTSQMGARSAAPETIKILVAKKELSVGTLLSEAKLNDMIGIAEFPKGTVPPDVVTKVELLKDKRLTRTLRIGDKIMPGDLGQGKEIQVPKDHQMYTLKMDPVKAVAGFALPGSKVDLILTESRDKKTVSNVLLRDMLVVAVDVIDQRPEGGKNAVPTLNSVSLAVTPIQGQMLALAAKRGDISMMLRDPENMDKTPLPPLEKLPFDKNDDVVSTPVAAGPKTVKIPVAKAEIAVNTKITNTNFDELFVDREFLDPAPANAARSKDDLLGKVIVRVIDADQFVPVAALSDKEMTTEQPAAPPMVVEEQPKPQRHELNIQSGASRTRAIYEAQDGKFRLLDGTESPSDAAPMPRKSKQPTIEPLPAVAPAPRPAVQPLPPPAPMPDPVPADVDANS